MEKINIIDFNTFKSTINNLYENEEFDLAFDIIKTNYSEIIHIKNELLFKQYANLFSEIAGDHKAYEFLENLLNVGIKNNMITTQEAENYIQKSPANRWL